MILGRGSGRMAPAATMTTSSLRLEKLSYLRSSWHECTLSLPTNHVEVAWGKISTTLVAEMALWSCSYSHRPRTWWGLRRSRQRNRFRPKYKNSRAPSAYVGCFSLAWWSQLLSPLSSCCICHFFLGIHWCTEQNAINTSWYKCSADRYCLVTRPVSRWHLHSKNMKTMTNE